MPIQKRYQQEKEKYNKESKEYYQTHKKKRLEYQKEYGKKPESKERKKKYMKKYGEENKDNPTFKLKRKGYQKKYSKENPKKIKAHNMANTYLKHLKQPGCEFHHPDYEEPLNVMVIPISEHKALHNQLNMMEEIR